MVQPSTFPVATFFHNALKAVLLLALAWAPHTLHAQSPAFKWAISFGGNNTDVAYHVAVDDSGNVYTVGYFSGTVQFGSTTLTQQGVLRDGYISKQDDQGNYIWAQHIYSTERSLVYDIDIDQRGNLYVTGYFRGNATINGKTYVNTGGGYGTDIYIAKLTRNGQFVWVNHYGSRGYDASYGIAVDNKGNLYNTGYFQQTINFNPELPGSPSLTAYIQNIYILSLDTAGNFRWVQNGEQGYRDWGFDVAVDTSGDVYAVGAFGEYRGKNVRFGSITLQARGSNIMVASDGYIAKLDPAGNFLWAKRMGGVDDERPLGVAADDSGNAYITGYMKSSGADFGSTTLNSNGIQDVFITKVDPSGNFRWAKNIGGTGDDEGRDIAVTGEGGVYTTGWFVSTVNFDPGAGTQNLTSAGRDIFIYKLESNGDFSWVKQIGNTQLNAGLGITTSCGNVYTTGDFAGTADFNTDAGTLNLTANGGVDAFVHRMGEDVSILATVTSNNPLCAGETIQFKGEGNANAYDWTGPAGFHSTQQNPVIPNAGTDAAGTYTLRIVSEAGCKYSSSVKVTVNPTYNDTIQKDICEGSSYTFNGNSYTTAGIHTARLQTVFGCDSVVTLDLGVHPIYSDTVTADICDGETYAFEGQQLHQSGNYIHRGTSVYGCDSITVLQLSVHDLPQLTVTQTPDGEYCYGDEVVLQGKGAVRYHWQGLVEEALNDYGTNDAITLPLQYHNIIYLTGTTEWNCTDSVHISIEAKVCCQVFVPNAFSPNGDGLNDKFGVRTIRPPKTMRLEVYNRWGNLVYVSYKPEDSWDGTIQGKPADVGTYFYRLSGTCRNDSPFEERGSLTLLR